MSKEEKFRKVIDANDNRIKSVCRYYSKDQEKQKDIYQEILVNIWKGLDSFRGDAQPGTWIYKIATNTALGFVMKEQKRLNLEVVLEEKNLKYFSEEPEVQHLPEKENMLNELENQINQLSVIDKILISLLLEDLSYRDIAEIVGITEPNVRVKIHRIKGILREKMNKD
jgi:RNA polymerase sigma-70 factor (ECF subfamily)